MDNLKTLYRLYKQYAKMDFLWLLRDTKYCLMQIFSDAVCAFCTIAGVYLLSVRFGGLGGMTQEEILFMMSYATIVEGIYMMFFIGCNTGMVSRIIGRGQLDHTVIQPVPLWIQLLAQGFSPFSGSTILIGGIGLSLYSIGNMFLAVTPGWIFLLVLYSISSTLIIVAVIYILSCMAFYAPAAAEEIAGVGKDLFSSLKTYPLGGMGKSAGTILLTVLPIGLTAWYPSKLLLMVGTEGVTWDQALEFLYLPAMTLILVMTALLLFKKGMKYYARCGSPRYSGFGHR